MNKQDILGMTLTELRDFVQSIGESAYRGNQLYTHLLRGDTLEEMQTLPKAMKDKLGDCALLTQPQITRRLVSEKDGTVKYLLRLHDGECVESVLMRYKHGNSLCISTQVGCRMGCAFCASTLAGRVRDLAASEMLGQVIAAQRDTGERVSSVVMMGIGEPLDNYEHSVRFLRLVSDGRGLNLSPRHVSLSTSGIVPAILRLAEENIPITLSISLHASDDESRSAIMPVNRAYPIDMLLSACATYFEKTGRRLSFEYTLLSGKNDSRMHADRLATLLHRYFDPIKAPIHVNLIRVNEVAETGFKTGTDDSARAFAAALGARGVNATVRRRLGEDVNAACGQLRRTAEKEKG